MSGRTTHLRTVVLATLCVVSLLAAPATAVATPENPFGGDSTDGTSSEDGLGDTLDRSSDTSSSNDRDGSGDDSGSTTESDDGADRTDDTDESDDDGSGTLSDSDDGESSAETGDDADGTDSSTDADGEDESTDGASSEDDSLLRSTLATSVNTTVHATSTTVEETTDTDADAWSSLDERSAETGATETSVDWSTIDETVGSTLPETGEDSTLEVAWYEAPLSQSTDRTTTRTDTLSQSLSGSVAGVTDGVLGGLTAVVDVEPVEGSTTGDVPVGAGVAATAPAGVEASTTGPADTSGPASRPERSALVPDDGLVDTGASLGATGSGTGTPLPTDSSPMTGFAVGVGGVAGLAAARQGLFATAGTGVAGTASAMAASVTPALTGRSSALDRLVRMLTAFRYSRYDDSDPLEHEARADVFDVVEETPGAYLSEVAERADLPLSTARHHVRVLEREELLMGAKVRGKRRFYPAYSGDIELAAALNDDSTAVVLDALARLGGASVSELADELGRDPSTVTHHLQRLEEDGLVVREREGRSVINRLSAQARTALEPEAEAPAAAEASGVVASD